MKTKETHDGEIKTYKDLQHVGILPPELIQRKLANGEALRRGDVRIGAENHESLQNMLNLGIGGALQFPILDGGSVTINLDDNGQFVEAFGEKGAVYTATDKEYKELRKNGKVKDGVCIPGIAVQISKVRLERLQEVAKAALAEALNGKTEFEIAKQKMLEVAGPKLKVGIETLCREQMDEQRRVRVHNMPGVAYDVEIALPHDVPVYPDRGFDRIILNAFDEGVLQGMLRETFNIDAHRECEEWEITDLEEEGNRIFVRWAFEGQDR